MCCASGTSIMLTNGPLGAWREMGVGRVLRMAGSSCDRDVGIDAAAPSTFTKLREDAGRSRCPAAGTSSSTRPPIGPRIGQCLQSTSVGGSREGTRALRPGR